MIRRCRKTVQDAIQTSYMKILYSLRVTLAPEDKKEKRKENKATILGYD